jgi:hypothetical protein
VKPAPPAHRTPERRGFHSPYEIDVLKFEAVNQLTSKLLNADALRSFDFYSVTANIISACRITFIPNPASTRRRLREGLFSQARAISHRLVRSSTKTLPSFVLQFSKSLISKAFRQSMNWHGVCCIACG